MGWGSEIVKAFAPAPRRAARGARPRRLRIARRGLLTAPARAANIAATARLGDPVGPRNPEPALQEEIFQTLIEPALRGEVLLGALAQWGARRSIEPFRALLGVIVSLDCPEPEAHRLVRAIEEHRAGLEGCLGRDPGFSVAACDLLHERDRTVRDPVFRMAGPAGDTGSRRDDIEPDAIEALRQETERAGHPGR